MRTYYTWKHRCDGCENATNIYRNNTNLHYIDHVTYECKLGKNWEECVVVKPKKKVNEAPAQVVEEKPGNDFMDQNGIDALRAKLMEEGELTDDGTGIQE
jgi:hypothetical protein